MFKQLPVILSMYRLKSYVFMHELMENIFFLTYAVSDYTKAKPYNKSVF